MGTGKIRIVTALIALLSCALFAESGAGGINFALPNASSGLFLDWGAAAEWSDIAYVNRFMRDGGTQGFQPCRGECEPPGFWARAIPATLFLSYMGYTIAARDYVYRDNPEDNWVGAVNGFCTGFILGALSAAWPMSLIDQPGLWGAVLITGAGVAAGWWLAGYKEKINKNPFMYYGVAVPVLVPLFMITMTIAIMI